MAVISEAQLRCGLLGEHLAHSYSPQIHAHLGAYSYRLFEVAPEALPDFLQNGAFDALNVTIPYKQDVIPFCAALSEKAARIGSVNTLLRRPDGTLYGDNTDYDGFSRLLSANGGIAAGEKALILGNGGACASVKAVLEDLGAEVIVVSRRGPIDYAALPQHADAVLLVNTTPVGMYPNNGQRPLDLSVLPHCRCVLDLIYNPVRTQLLLDAQARGIHAACGLLMLAAQAKRAAELFTGRRIPDEAVTEICEQLRRQMENIILIGMPGCGKTTVGKLLAKQLNRPFFDADAEIVKRLGCDIPTFFAQKGEEAFRLAESELLSDLGKRSGCVIATGGGCVMRKENYAYLHQNGVIFWRKRDLSKLPTKGRPLSQTHALTELYETRRSLYAHFADHILESTPTPAAAAEAILRLL